VPERRLRMNIHARYAGTTWTCKDFWTLRIDLSADGRNTHSGSRACRGPTGYRSAIERSKQGLTADE